MVSLQFARVRNGATTVAEDGLKAITQPMETNLCFVGAWTVELAQPAFVGGRPII
jgi:hypothetical protein